MKRPVLNPWAIATLAAICFVFIAADSIGPNVPSLFSRIVSTNKTADAWRTALGTGSGTDLTTVSNAHLATAANLVTVSNAQVATAGGLVTVSNAQVTTSANLLSVSNAQVTTDGKLSGFVTNLGGLATNAALTGGTVTGQTNLDLTASRVMVSDANGRPSSSSVTSPTLAFLDATSSVQTQLDSKPTVALTNVALLNASANGFAGKVGAGVTSPSDVLHISAPTATLSARLHNTTSGNSVYWQAFDANTMELYYGNSGGWLQWRAPLTRVVGTDSSVVPFAVKSAASQAVNVQEWQTNTGAVIAAVTSSGALRLGDAGGNPATVSNGAFVFGKDVAGTVELFVMDEAGNVTQISPHARASSPAPRQLDAGDKTPIVIHHANLFTGEQEWLHLSAMAKDMERITGRRYIYKAKIADAEKREWEAEQKKVEGLRVAERSADAKRVDAWRRGQGDSKETEPKVRPNYVPKPKPEFLR